MTTHSTALDSTEDSLSADGILARLKFSTTSRLPMIHQTEAAECGLACLAMISGYHGFTTDLTQLRKRFSLSNHGMTLKNIIDIAAKMNVVGRALRVEPDDLLNQHAPCILHWDMNHFVVLKQASANKFVIHDPALGVRQLSRADFCKHFTGIVLELEPTSEFVAGGDKTPLKLYHFWQRIVGLKRGLLHVFLLSLLLQVIVLAGPYYIQLVVDKVLLGSDENLLVVLAIGFTLLMLTRNITKALRDYVVLGLSTKLNIQMAANLFRHLVRLPLTYFEKRHMGDIVSRFGSLESIREILTQGFVSALLDGLMAIATLIAMTIYSVKLGLIVTGFVILYATLRITLFQPYRLLKEESIVARAKEESNFMETMRAMQTIKLFQKENDRQSQWLNTYAGVMNTNIRIARWDISFSFMNGLIFGMENVLVVYFSADAVMGNFMSLGMLYAFMSYKQQFVGRMESLIGTLIDFKMVGLHLDRLADIAFTTQEKIHTNTQSDVLGNANTEKVIDGNIEVQSLSFSYSDTEPDALTDVSFDVKAGESIAIVGPSGCGKSTLIKCMMGLFEQSDGSLLIDGTPLSRISNYREQISAVMQDDQLLSGSIADNIACFVPRPDLERVRICAHVAAIDADILNMPMQYNTLVGDMGTSLSGGQKQRIVLARALYRNPRILFMDEATSSLDLKNESIINENIQALNITRVIVAHRPETIAMADKVYTLSET